MTRHELAVAKYRHDNPRSRAYSTWTYYGSTGSVRRATCVFCRRTISTCSANWPETRRFTRDAREHSRACAEAYLIGDR
jgi:hypothetical protein